ncbi:ribonuclease P protein component [Enemella evansiae]|uniref:ribonuclease P protein component n=1 Tax=Enemella evansiae TaxID=2016499 RepID=UPI000B96747A|nr:ribonuclease P protein component [Enemella evansiae]OYO02493.1 ribonuclease P protein component [Enemella evansiae]OYO02989.1 ribonuclease P protein component [Enemella evansiae]OYO12155.1 ribonuclease P protein component [Enemella evansiae]
MLPAALRMRSAAEFRRTISSGVRSGRSTLVVHAHQPVTDGGGTTTVGFVVSKAVGGAVVRNRVKRRLRHLSVPLLAETPAGTRVVVRALPPAATAPELGNDLRGAWHGCLRKLAAYRPKQPAPETVRR